MNDATLTELKIVVERIVRPLHAPLFRKRRIREELLTHLVSMFDQEASKFSDERAALKQAKRRFGDPEELTAQLQETVPGWDRICYWSEKMQYQPRESLLHYLGKCLLFTLAVCCAMILAIWIAEQPQDEFHLVACVVTSAVVWGIGPLMVIELFGMRMRRTLSGGESPSPVRLTALYAMMSLPIIPAAAFLTQWALTGDLESSLLHLRFACYFAPIAPILLVFLSYKRAARMCYENEWATLEIG